MALLYQPEVKLHSHLLHSVTDLYSFTHLQSSQIAGICCLGTLHPILCQVVNNFAKSVISSIRKWKINLFFPPLEDTKW